MVPATPSKDMAAPAGETDLSLIGKAPALYSVDPDGDQTSLTGAVLAALPGRTCVLDRTGSVLLVNERFRQEGPYGGGPGSGPQPGQHYLTGLAEHLNAAELVELSTIVTAVIHGRTGATNVEVSHDDGVHTQCTAVEVTPLAMAGGGAILTHSDITEQRSRESELTRRATHDALTGLPNRLLLSDRLASSLDKARLVGRRTAILFCDLDQFKLINDTMGHAAGDQLLITTGSRLQTACRSTDTVARFGGDEFVILLEDVADEQGVADTAHRILSAISQPIQVDGAVVFTNASVGVALSDPPGGDKSDAESLLRDADAAMFAAKQSGRGQVVWFQQSVRDRVSARLQTAAELRGVVDRQELRVVYQPIMNEEGAAVGAEAFVRWQHPTRGPLAPEAFLEIAEESGAVVPMGSWVLMTACRDALSWWSLDGVRPSVSVNISPRELATTDLPRSVRQALAETGLPASALILEITEAGIAADPEKSRKTLAAVRRMGVRIALDDFGTGNSSLAVLRHIEIDQIKIDKSFITEIGPDSDDQELALVDALIRLAHGLRAVAIAEGVETTLQMEALRKVGCDLFQGYLWSPPVPADDVISMMHAARSESADRWPAGQ
jgi:diguanylate cyclase (GGDEF)-like protein